MAKNTNVQYKIVIRRGDKAGTFERGDGKPILTLGEAHAYAEDCRDDADEVVILKEEVVARLPGKRRGGLNGRTPAKPC